MPGYSFALVVSRDSAILSAADSFCFMFAKKEHTPMHVDRDMMIEPAKLDTMSEDDKDTARRRSCGGTRCNKGNDILDPWADDALPRLQDHRAPAESPAVRPRVKPRPSYRRNGEPWRSRNGMFPSPSPPKLRRHPRHGKRIIAFSLGCSCALSFSAKSSSTRRTRSLMPRLRPRGWAAIWQGSSYNGARHHD